MLSDMVRAQRACVQRGLFWSVLVPSRPGPSRPVPSRSLYQSLHLRRPTDRHATGSFKRLQ